MLPTGSVGMLLMCQSETRGCERTCHSKTALSVEVLTSYLKAARGIIRHTLSCTACSLRNAVDQRGG